MTKVKRLLKLLHNRRECFRYLESPLRDDLAKILQTGSLHAWIDIDRGSTSSAEKQRLRELLTEANGIPGPVIEIGTLFGFTTLDLALDKNPDKKLVTVDNYSWNPWGLTPEMHRGLTRHVLRLACELHNVEIIVQDKSAFYAAYVGQAPSMVFLDAIHSYEETRNDIRWAKNVGTTLITGHDYGRDFPGVMQAVDDEGKAEVVDTLWVLRDWKAS
jgi:hypothetical protein